MKERKIGEVFEFGGEWYQCVKSPDGSCKHCDMNFGGKCPIPTKECMAILRSDLSYVVFKKLEKVGEPYMLEDKKFQKYKVFKTPYIYHKIDCSWQSFADPYYISLEIKQNKEEGMKEKKVKLSQEEYDYIRNKIKIVILPGNLADDVDSDDLGSEIMKLFSIDEKRTKIEANGTCFNNYKKEDCHTREFYVEVKQNKEDMEEKKLNLKPFDLEAAKAGKPVCTRDGRKARIICFDRNDLYPIVALIECEDGKEIIGAYSKEGQTEIYEIKGTNLMMLPEKKEGWVNVYKGIDGVTFSKYPYTSKDEAIKESDILFGRIDTIKVEWEE